jgi:hypothetical protein
MSRQIPSALFDAPGRTKSEVRNPKNPNRRPRAGVVVRGKTVDSDFGFRASDFGFVFNFGF